ncbi:hypothetical protein SAMN06265827_105127 [Orenia metallireducens]|uniref:DUF5675 domain-containing protein n=1 Tax=Orenia metallireducens TaxID=1413210 RepID=A0A285GAB0_9FIRM|nr:DUF5675 family protein [Orenia metallireducens]SNY19466.1 hypothetical protein SAMN06265827_105127 [Orenia metallireducens]
MNKIRVIRKKETADSTQGELYLDSEQIGYTLEPAWNRNKKGSCIPPGEYLAYIRDHEHSGSRWNYNPIQLINVFNRNYIQIHIGNYPEDTRGCILIGKGKGDNAIWNSKKAYEELMSKLDKTREIKVIVEYE